MLVYIFLFVFLHDYFIAAAHIGIIANTGCYSHQMLARNLAEKLTLEANHRVTIIQTHVYGFNISYPKPKAHWDYIMFNGTCPESIEWQEKAQRFMWIGALACNFENFDIKGVEVFYGLHYFHMRACAGALRSEEFVERIEKLNLDLLVIDHIINDCAEGLASALISKVKLAYFSNYPIVGYYADIMGVPSIPSHVPSVLGQHTSPMDTVDRLKNTITYMFLLATRRVFYWRVYQVFKAAMNVNLSRLSELGKRTVVFATPYEFLLDVPRPLVAGVQYFGCEHCGDTGKIGNVTRTLSLPPTQTKGFILVTFGTMTRGDLVALHQLIRIFGAFAKFPEYTIIWQLDAPRSYYEQAVLKALNSTSLPPHIHVRSWMPLKTLLTDPRVVLVISQGGISTCMEVVNAAVPMLGMAIQGDQGYNMQRLWEKGVAEFLQVTSLSETSLAEKMSLMLREKARYKAAAIRLRSMLRHYKSLQKSSPSVFWLSWAERHFGRHRGNSQKVAESAVLSKHPSNWLIYYNIEIWLIGVAVVGLVSYLIRY